ncbi:unnamed protein product [Phytomonas sp. Hart1]|nr:unnamed protein product [Phytomonas sp. Hart1]|eukprot:CCW67956.1 unnamed protein product [Phytomonas sp. isolate Hart1]
MPEEIRTYFQGRGKLISFLRRHPFLFDIRNLECVSRLDVRLQKEVNHPRCGAADHKFMMTDIGVVESYVAKPEFILSMDSIESTNKGVFLHPQSAPPAIRVKLEERMPVLDRLVALIPVDFELVKKVEENIPDDIIFHPYFDCQGGLASIASKFPDDFQVVDGKIRRRPPHLAPLSLNDFTLKQSPIPEIASLVEREVCDTNIPRWVNITSLYEQLTPQQKREVKQVFKSFARFLRAHGKSVSVSQDMLCVSMWIPPMSSSIDTASDQHSSSTNSANATALGGNEPCISKAKPPCITTNESDPVDVNTLEHQKPLRHDGIPPHIHAPHLQLIQTTSKRTFQLQVINELFDRFPAHQTLNLVEALQLLPDSLQQGLPKGILNWISCHHDYFVVDNPDEKDPLAVRIQRVSDRQPLDIVRILYQAMQRLQQHERKECTVSVEDLIKTLNPTDQHIVTQMGIGKVVNLLPEWLKLEPAPHVLFKSSHIPTEEAIARGDYCLRQLRSLVELEESTAIEREERIGLWNDSKKNNEGNR